MNYDAAHAPTTACCLIYFVTSHAFGVSTKTDLPFRCAEKKPFFFVARYRCAALSKIKTFFVRVVSQANFSVVNSIGVVGAKFEHLFVVIINFIVNA